MFRIQTLRFVLAALVFAGGVLPARAMQLGESKAQTLERHGTPGAEDRGKNVAIYFWDGWSAELEFKEEAIHKLIYRRNGYLEPTEVTALLQSNGGATRWREATPAGEPTRQWVRDDGATATCLAVRPLMMTFQAGHGPAATTAPRYGAPAKPKVVVGAAPPVVSSTPPTFPKLLGSVPQPDSEPVAAASPAPPPPARSFPKLRSEEIASEPVVNSEKAAIAPEKPRNSGRFTAVPVDGTEDRPDDAVVQPLPSPAPSSDGSGSTPWLVALLAVAIGGAVYWFKFRVPRDSDRVSPSEPTFRPSTPRVESTQPALVTNPALDALRGDQLELLVGEIFRREGYAVELSAAAAQGDSIDLTLRRDSETILVQCKHWKTSRVTEREVREFHTAMMTNGAPRGIFVTAGCFSREAQEFAVGKDIDLMDRTALEECTAAVAKPGEDFCGIKDWIDEFAAHARIFDPECPNCQGSMVIRNSRTNGAPSWACRNHPRCPGRREARRDLLAVAAHH